MAKDTKIKQILRDNKITQRDIAKRFNLTVQHVNYVVNGSRKSKSLENRIIQVCKASR